ncbi:MAG TPA: lamin tail domain-containing protein, partial [Verrucomicrobiota bacterium]|nr:lamin tail domain-containing protein [Verrucomicrobiota bacterium]
PGGANGWSGISFLDATNENRLAHLTMGNYGSTALWLSNSTLVAEHVVWTNSTRNVIMLDNSSLAVRHSRFPNLEWYEAVSGIGIPTNGFLILEGNTFGTTVGYCDVIDFSGGKRPGPVLQVLDNVFLGGSDDGLDLDGTDAHIEGNVFMHFHKNNSSTSESSAISTGYYQKVSELVIVRNLFFDNDNDMVLKDAARVWAHNNTFVASRLGSLCFTEPERPNQSSATLVHLDGNIFWQHPVVMRNLDTNLIASHALDLRVNQSILPQPGPWSGVGNLDVDPLFVNPAGDFHLRPASPARATGPLGLDMGAFVPAGAVLSGEPSPQTWRRDATVTVGGPGIMSYRYRLNDGAWSGQQSIAQPIALAGLADGTYRLEVLGCNSAAVWQPESAPTLSRSWTVAANAARVRISEVLAANGTAVLWNNAYPDLIELHNDGPDAADLSGLSLTDDLNQPRAFTFAPNTILAPHEYLVLIADRNIAAPDVHPGFQLSREGGVVALFDREPDGGQLLDRVDYGMQIEGLSIAWTDSGEWRLARPSFGGPNQPVPLGDSARVRINEWLANAGLNHRNDFIELYNPEALPVALSGFFLTDEPAGWPRRHPLPPLSFLPARGYAVFVADGDPDQGAHHLNFKLALEQGLLGLFDQAGTRVDIVAYGPQQPDQSEGRTPSGSSNVVFFQHPTPGAPPKSPDPSATPVVLNEVLAHPLPSSVPDNPNTDWIELCNRGQIPIDLAGLSLSDRTDQPRRWVFPSGMTLDPGGFLLVLFDSSAPASATNTGFGLSATGDSVFLFDRPENDGLLLDALTFGIQAAGLSLARIPAGGNDWQLSLPTPGSDNQPVAVDPPDRLRINEWMADPIDGDDWFEVFNPGSRPVRLGGLRFTDELANSAKSVVPAFSFIGVGLGGYQVFVADSDPSKGADHVNFRLSASGETIGMTSLDGLLIDAVHFGPQDEGVSEGRLPDGADRVVGFPTSSTPGARNRDADDLELRVALPTTAEVLLSWEASIGVRYAIERTSSLASGQWTTVAEMTADDHEEQHSERLSPANQSFYRLRVVP